MLAWSHWHVLEWWMSRHRDRHMVDRLVTMMMMMWDRLYWHCLSLVSSPLDHVEIVKRDVVVVHHRTTTTNTTSEYDPSDLDWYRASRWLVISVIDTVEQWYGYNLAIVDVPWSNVYNVCVVVVVVLSTGW